MKIANPVARNTTALGICLLAAALGFSSCAQQPSRQHDAPPQRQPPAHPTQATFDYYLLALSWSPEYCASPNGEDDQLQCASGRRYGFVVHGLWPQFEQGYPQFCGEAPLPESLVQRMLPIMPSPALVRHEWRKHGTCSGLGPAAYFALTERAFRSITIPPQYRQPESYLSVEPARLKADFLEANGWGEGIVFLHCGGRYFRELRICLDRDLRPRACGVDIRDNCRSAKLVLRPVR